MRLTFLKIIVVFVLGGLSSAFASNAPLIDAATLKAKLGQPGVVVLEIQPRQYYVQAHLPDSTRTDYANWRNTDPNGVPEMLPGAAQLEQLIGRLGIDNGSEVIIVPIGQGPGEMAVATRIYWSLYIAGLNELSILNGGLIGYYNTYGAEGLVGGSDSNPEAKEFKIKLREPELMDMDKVQEYIDNGYGLLDARSQAEYRGEVAGSAKERPGALPGAKNVPFNTMMNAKGDAFLDTDAIRALYQAAGMPTEGPQLTYCHSGHRASVAWFVSHELLGNDEALMYDGSMLEWAATPDRPLVLGLGK